MRQTSLTVRVLLGAAVWIVIALSAGGYAIFDVFRTSALRQFDQRLEQELDLLSVAVARAPDALRSRMTSPGFARVYSGDYWLAEREDGTVFTSRSLWDARLPIDGADGLISRRFVPGPDDQRLRLLARRLTAPDGTAWRIAVASDLALLDRETVAFQQGLLLSGAWLALALIVAAALLLRSALWPLRELRRAVRAQKSGDAVSVPKAFPSEVSPLVQDLNAMLEKNARLREKGRVQAANLAHALKTPAAILQNEVDRALAGGAVDLRLAEEAVSRITAAADRHLTHAGQGPEDLPPGEAFDAVAVTEELLRAVRRLFPGIDFAQRGPRRLYLAVPAADQQEMLGNLLENAGKWARTRVVATLAAEDTRAALAVEDDGPGIPADLRDRILEQGVRLDQVKGGSGLGLSIVKDLVECYGGALCLGTSPLGGLRVQVSFPYDPSNPKLNRT